MTQQLRLLLATDYSESAISAEYYAVQLAKNAGCVLRVLHVFNPPLAEPVTTFDQAKIDYNPLVYETQRLEEHMQKLLDHFSIDLNSINIQCIVREGMNAATHIIEEAEESDADLIIAGTHGAGIIHKALLGSHTWSIIKKSRIPVLAVPEGSLFRPVNKMVFATEYREGEFTAIQLLIQMARQLDASITVLHVTNDVLPDAFEQRLFEDFKNEVKDKTTYPHLDIQLMRDDNIVEGLNQYCTDHAVNWLVMSPQKLSIWDKLLNPVGAGSNTKQMSFESRIPLLVIPDYYSAMYID